MFKNNLMYMTTEYYNTNYYSIHRIIVTLLFGSFFLVCYGQSIIQLEKDGGVLKVPCVVNGLRLKLIFDTGASNVCISQSIALMMLENDYLSASDIKGTAQSQVADGRIVDHTKINLRKIQIGDKVLTNVEAVVIHEQTTPLLLGQSALKRLGRYSISGDKLILGTESPKPSLNKKGNKRALYDALSEDYDLGSFEQFALDVEDEGKRRKLYDAIKDEYDVSDFDSFTRYLLGDALSDEDIDQLFQEADNSYNEGTYSLAIEKYRILNEHNLLSAQGKMQYADCYYYLDRKEEALQLYYDIQEEIVSDYPQYKVSLYYQIGRCLWILEDFDAAIPYFEKVKYHAKPWSSLQRSAVEILSSIYIDKGFGYRARSVIDDYINQYLAFMEIKATDCWDKLYVDEFLSDLYYRRYLSSSDSLNDIEKYIIIAAAWGNKEAIEYCKEKEIDYSSKPYKYEY